jgi:hypothetical protein
MNRILFVAIAAAVLFRWSGSWRRIVGVTLIAALTAGLIFPPPVYAQFGLLGGIQNISDCAVPRLDAVDLCCAGKQCDTADSGCTRRYSSESPNERLP